MIYRTTERWKYRSILYEDVISSIEMKKVGKLGMATMLISMTLPKTGTNKGGMHDTYEDGSDYVSSFHVVMANPDCAKVAQGRKINQRIDWAAATPKIINERWRKKADAE
jgi:hypothetical protein